MNIALVNTLVDCGHKEIKSEWETWMFVEFNTKASC